MHGTALLQFNLQPRQKSSQEYLISTPELRRERFAGPGEQSQVTAHRDHCAALRQPMPRVGFEHRKNPSRLARLADALHSVLDGHANVRMAIVTQMTERSCQVAGADKQAIDTLHGRDGLQV